jgi:hypothetical protein
VQALARHDLIDLILSSRIPVARLIDWLDQALLYQHAPQEFKSMRRRGVRSATDFLQVCGHREAREAFFSGNWSDIKPELLAAILHNDEWLAYVSNWRKYDVTAPPRTRRYSVTKLMCIIKPRWGNLQWPLVDVAWAATATNGQAIHEHLSQCHCNSQSLTSFDDAEVTPR